MASDVITIIDDGTIPGGLGSQPFDGEGVPTCKKALIQNGVLNQFLYNTYWARKMETKSTGNAKRNYRSVPYTDTLNLYMEAGPYSPEDIIKSVDNGLYLTDTMGSGMNPSTGDFSVGAEGFWIRDGKLAEPVSEITIAGNVAEAFGGVKMVGNDLVADDSEFAPTFKIEELTIAGLEQESHRVRDLWANGLKPRRFMGA